MLAFVGVVFLAGCDREPIMSPVPVSPVDLRNALPEVQKTGGSVVKDDDGKSQIVRAGDDVELLPEPEKTRTQMSLSTLVSTCLPNDAPHCALDGRVKHPLVYVDSGNAYYNPHWGTIGAAALGLGLVGGVVAAETYCFVNCGTGGKIALVTVDVVGAVVGTIAVLGFFAAVAHGMNN